MSKNKGVRGNRIQKGAGKVTGDEKTTKNPRPIRLITSANELPTNTNTKPGKPKSSTPSNSDKEKKPDN